MKKKLLAFIVAAALTVAAPASAWAVVHSPGGSTSVDAGNGVSAHVTFDGTLNVDATTTQASNVVLAENEQVMASIEVTGEGVSADNPLTLTFSVGSQYAGASARVFVQHNDGTTEIIPATVNADGTVSVTVDRLSIFTLVVDTASVKAAAGPQGGTTTQTSATGTAATTDKAAGSTSSTVSPKTGVDMGMVALGTVAFAVCAGGVAVAIRKEIAA